jgi:hypothetical protein
MFGAKWWAYLKVGPRLGRTRLAPGSARAPKAGRALGWDMIGV